MNLIPWKLRNMINPHQTAREMSKQARDAERLYRKLPEHQRKEFSREDEPDRDWTWQGRVLDDDGPVVLVDERAWDHVPGLWRNANI